MHVCVCIDIIITMAALSSTTALKRHIDDSTAATNKKSKMPVPVPFVDAWCKNAVIDKCENTPWGTTYYHIKRYRFQHFTKWYRLIDGKKPDPMIIGYVSANTVAFYNFLAIENKMSDIIRIPSKTKQGVDVVLSSIPTGLGTYSGGMIHPLFMDLLDPKDSSSKLMALLADESCPPKEVDRRLTLYEWMKEPDVKKRAPLSIPVSGLLNCVTDRHVKAEARSLVLMYIELSLCTNLPDDQLWNGLLILERKLLAERLTRSISPLAVARMVDRYYMAHGGDGAKWLRMKDSSSEWPFDSGTPPEQFDPHTVGCLQRKSGRYKPQSEFVWNQLKYESSLQWISIPFEKVPQAVKLRSCVMVAGQAMAPCSSKWFGSMCRVLLDSCLVQRHNLLIKSVYAIRNRAMIDRTMVNEKRVLNQLRDLMSDYNWRLIQLTSDGTARKQNALPPIRDVAKSLPNLPPCMNKLLDRGHLPYHERIITVNLLASAGVVPAALFNMWEVTFVKHFNDLGRNGSLEFDHIKNEVRKLFIRPRQRSCQTMMREGACPVLNEMRSSNPNKIPWPTEVTMQCASRIPSKKPIHYPSDFVLYKLS